MSKQIPVIAWCLFSLLGRTDFCFSRTGAVSAEEQAILCRLIPLPKEITVQEAVHVPASEIRVEAMSGSGEMVQSAADKIRTLLHSPSNLDRSHGRFTIRLAVMDGKNPADTAWREQTESLQTLPNRDQAYVIAPVENRELTVAGLSEQGVYFGVTTLCQILEGRIHDGQVSIPLVRVRDWPDIEQRGFWDSSFSEKQIEKLESLKMNMVQVSPQLGFDEQGRGIVTRMPKDDWKSADSGMEYSTFCYRHGIKCIPYIPHLSTLGKTGIYDRYPELMGQGKSARSAKHKRWQAPCTSQPAFAKVLSEWMTGLAALPHVDEISVWLTEEGVNCGCPKCLKQGEFVAQTRAIVSAWRLAQKQYPNLKCQLLLTQGSYPTNGKVLAEAPPDLRIMYYDGGRTYDSSREPMIYPLLTNFAAKGGWLGVVPQTTASWAMVLPWSCPQSIRQQMNEFTAKKLRAVLEYAHPNIDLYDFNVTAFGEWSWNSGGRTEGQFTEAWASRKGFQNPQTVVQWADLLGPASWNLYGSKFPYELYWYDAGTLVQSRMKPSWGKGIFHYFKNAEDLDRNMADCGTALEIARTTGSEELIEETQIVQSYYTMLKAISQIMMCVSETSNRDEIRKQQIRQHIADLKGGMEQLETILPRWGGHYGIGRDEGRLGNTIRDMRKIVNSIVHAARTQMGEK